MFKRGDVVRYEGDQHPWGHAVVVKTSGEGVTVDLDHVGLVLVQPDEVTLRAKLGAAR